MAFHKKGTTLPETDRSTVYKLIGSNKKLLIQEWKKLHNFGIPQNGIKEFLGTTQNNKLYWSTQLI